MFCLKKYGIKSYCYNPFVDLASDVHINIKQISVPNMPCIIIRTLHFLLFVSCHI